MNDSIKKPFSTSNYERPVKQDVTVEPLLSKALSELSKQMDRHEENVIRVTASVRKIASTDGVIREDPPHPDVDETLIGELTSLVYRFGVYNNRLEDLNSHLSTII